MAKYQVYVDGVCVFEHDNRSMAAQYIDKLLCPNLFSGVVDLREGNHIHQSWSYIGVNPRGQSMWRDSVAPIVYESSIPDVDTGHGRRNMMPRGDWTIATVGLGKKDSSFKKGQ